MSITEIARFADVYEAEIAASRLRSDGFDPVLGGAEHAKTNTLAVLALGGVNLSVPKDQADAARLLLDSLRAGIERIGDEEPGNAAPTRSLGPIALLVAVITGVLLVLFGWKHPPLLDVRAIPFW